MESLQAHFDAALTAHDESLGLHVPPSVVITKHPLATEVGLSVLEEGGNAWDAVVAIGFTLAVGTATYVWTGRWCLPTRLQGKRRF